MAGRAEKVWIDYRRRGAIGSSKERPELSTSATPATCCPTTGAGTVLLVRSFAWPPICARGAAFCSRPRGKLDATIQGPAARREAERSSADAWRPSSAYSSLHDPAVLTERISFFLALTALRIDIGRRRHAHRGEESRWFETTLTKAMEMIARGESIDARPSFSFSI